MCYFIDVPLCTTTHWDSGFISNFHVLNREIARNTCQCKKKRSVTQGSVFLPGVVEHQSHNNAHLWDKRHSAHCAWRSCRWSGLVDMLVTCQNGDLCLCPSLTPRSRSDCQHTPRSKAITLRNQNRIFLKFNRNQCLNLCSARNNRLK